MDFQSNNNLVTVLNQKDLYSSELFNNINKEATDKKVKIYQNNNINKKHTIFKNYSSNQIQNQVSFKNSNNNNNSNNKERNEKEKDIALPIIEKRLREISSLGLKTNKTNSIYNRNNLTNNSNYNSNFNNQRTTQLSHMENTYISNNNLSQIYYNNNNSNSNRTNYANNSINQLDLMSCFNNGINNLHQEKLNYKKDILIMLNVYDKYPKQIIPSIQKHNQMISTKTKPFYKVNTNSETLSSNRLDYDVINNVNNSSLQTENLFDLSIQRLTTLYDVIIISQQYTNNLYLDFLSYLPCLDTLKLRFCGVDLSDYMLRYDSTIQAYSTYKSSNSNADLYSNNKEHYEKENNNNTKYNNNYNLNNNSNSFHDMDMNNASINKNSNISSHRKTHNEDNNNENNDISINNTTKGEGKVSSNTELQDVSENIIRSNVKFSGRIDINDSNADDENDNILRRNSYKEPKNDENNKIAESLNVNKEEDNLLVKKAKTTLKISAYTNHYKNNIDNTNEQSNPQSLSNNNSSININNNNNNNNKINIVSEIESENQGETNNSEFFSIKENNVANNNNNNKIVVSPNKLSYKTRPFFKTLTTLHLEYCELNNSSLSFITKIKTLKDLNLSGNHFTQEMEVNEFINLPLLEKLVMINNKIESNYINFGNSLINKENNKTNNSIKYQNKQILNDTSNDYNRNSYNLNINEVSETKKKSKTDINNEGIGLNSNNNNIHNINTNTNENGFYSSKYNFRYLKDILQTNIRDFFNVLSQLTKLKHLNLSHNKIHFFDIDPYINKTDKNNDTKTTNNHFDNYNGFPQLTTLDLSNNNIQEEVGLLLIMNINNLKELIITNNPICHLKQSIENVEYEFLKNSETVIINETEYPHNEKGYIVKKYKVPNPSNVFKIVKNRLNKLLVQRNTIYEEMKINEYNKNENDNKINNSENNNNNNANSNNKDMLFLTEDASIKTKQISNLNSNNYSNANDINIKEYKKSLVKEIENNDKEIRKQVYNNYEFINKKNQKNKKKKNINQEEMVDLLEEEKPSPYDEVLKIAQDCYGNQKHYKEVYDIPKAYRELRMLLKTSQFS